MILNTYKSLLSRNLQTYGFQYRLIFGSTTLRSKNVPEEALPKNLLEKFQTSHLQENGVIYDKRPFRIKLQANKKYAWCCCGQSKSQPFCDGTHKIYNLKIKLKPIFFKVEETKDYWICNCKQSLHRPFCDGTHERKYIQEKIKRYKT